MNSNHNQSRTIGGQAVPIKPRKAARRPAKGGSARKPHNEYPWLGNIPLITDEAIEKVSRFLETVEKGRSVDLRSPLYGGAPREEILTNWIKILDPLIADNALLTEFEHSAAEKDSPMSVMLPYSERAHQVESYFTNPGGDISDDTLARACDAVYEMLNLGNLRGRLRAISLEHACDRLPSNTSWGLPYALRGVVSAKVEKSSSETSNEELQTQKTDERRIDNRPLYLALAHEMAQDLNHPGWEVPCMLYWRGDLGKDGVPKQRVVWGYPHAVSILESAVYSVLTDALRGRPGFAAWTDLPNTEQEVFRILEGSTEETPTWAFDATAFDQHLSGKLIEAVSERLVIPCFQSGSAELIRRLSLYSRTCGIVTPDGVKVGRDFNRPSGSGGTNLLDCLENLVMFAAVALSLGVEYELVVELLKQVMGDDAVFATWTGFDKDQVTALYLKLFGAVVNVDKEALSSKFTSFCKRLYERGQAKSWASTCRALLKAVSYEHQRPIGWNDYCDSVRWIMQACTIWGHPCDKQYVKYLIEGDKYRLGLSVPGGPLQLFKLASDGGSVDLDQILGLRAWANEFHGYSANSPSALPVMDYLLELYAAQAS